MSAGNAVKISNYTRPVDLLEIANRSKSAGAKQAAEPGTFKEMFSTEMASAGGLTFSKHASQRLYSRGIELTSQQLADIANAVDKAAAKGSKETLILTDDAALVVAVENRTVVTAFDRDNLREGVVTSIDSAVIL